LIDHDNLEEYAEPVVVDRRREARSLHSCEGPKTKYGCVWRPPAVRQSSTRRSTRVGLRAQMGPLRKSISVRLEESVHARLRRQSLRSGVPTSALVRALVHRWLVEQDEVGEVARVPGQEHERQPGLFGEEGGL
jgi:hypothetical protein